MENSIHYKLRECHTNCQKTIIGRIKENTDLRPGEPKILEFLLEHEPCEQKQIATGCSLDSASVTGILGRMEKRGLVKRENMNGNRRSMSVKSNLGVSPVSSIPYTITRITGLEMGKATILFHIVLVALQILILRKAFKIKNLLQVVVGVVFGYYTACRRGSNESCVR